MDWIFHLDTDELIHPAGTREYSLRQLLSDIPGNVDMVIFPNYVSEKDFFKCKISFDMVNNIAFLCWHMYYFRRAVLNEMILRNLSVRYILFGLHLT